MAQPTSPSSPSPLVGASGLVLGIGSVAAGTALVRGAGSAFGATWASLFVVVGVVLLLSLVTFLPGWSRPAPPPREVVRDGEPARFHPYPVGRAEVVGTLVLLLLGGWCVAVGVVGVGRMGRHHARLWTQVAGCDLVGVVDSSAERRQQVIDQYGGAGHAEGEISEEHTSELQSH